MPRVGTYVGVLWHQAAGARGKPNGRGQRKSNRRRTAADLGCPASREAPRHDGQKPEVDSKRTRPPRAIPSAHIHVGPIAALQPQTKSPIERTGVLAVLRGHAGASIQSLDRPADRQWARLHRHRLQERKPAAKSLKADAVGITSNRVAVFGGSGSWQPARPRAQASGPSLSLSDGPLHRPLPA